MLPWEGDETTKAEIKEPYFHEEAWECNESLDYYGWAEYESPVNYEFTHPLSEILMALVNNELRIRFFGEYEKDISNGFAWLEQRNMRIPLSFILIGEKQKEIINEDKTNRTARSENSRI